jgi:transglutaminase-like putative cysteine protease
MTRGRAAAFAPAALAAVTMAAALGLARIFADGSFAGRILVAAALPHLVGAGIRRVRRGPVVTVAVTAAALVVWCTWAFAPATAAYGLPTPATLARLGTYLADGWHVFRTGIAPVAPTRGVVLLCAVIVAVAGTVADLLAFTRRATIGALVPTLLLFVLASTLGTDELMVVTTVAYLVAALVFLLLASQTRLEERRAWCTGRRLRSDASIVSAGLAVGGVAMLAGLLLAPALPGADAGPLLDYKGLGSRGTGPGAYRTLSPLVDIRARLLDQGDAELFRVRSPRRLPWRIAALDHFDGTVWGIESTARDASTVLRRRPGTTGIDQEFSIGALGAQWLPAAYRPRSVDLGGTRIIPESATLIAPGRSIAGLRYRVTSEVPPATPDDAAIAAIAATSAPDHAHARFTELPGGFPTSVTRQARAIVRGATTPYAAAKQLEQFFLDGSFVYDLGVKGGSDTNAIVEFLTRRRGFCEQFAGTYAAMARAVGLPARVAVGFTPGTYDASDGRYVVTSRNAHAWPEVWLAGMGWTAFEPTPAGSAPGQADPTIGAPTGPEPGPATSPTTAARSPRTTPGPTNPASPAPAGSAVQAGSAPTGSGSSSNRGLITAVVLLALTVGAATTWVARRLLRKRRRRAERRHAPTPTRSVTGAWQDALDGLAEAGLPAAAALTPLEQSAAYRARGAPDDAVRALDRLADTYGRIAWSDRVATEAEVVGAWSDADAVRAALAAPATRVERARRALREPVG